MAVRALLREWLLRTIESVAEPLLSQEDEWGFRPLLELYHDLDQQLLHCLIRRGLSNANSAIQEAAQDAQGWSRE
jgi:hypothetical protein